MITPERTSSDFPLGKLYRDEGEKATAGIHFRSKAGSYSVPSVQTAWRQFTRGPEALHGHRVIFR